MCPRYYTGTMYYADRDGAMIVGRRGASIPLQSIRLAVYLPMDSYAIK